CDRGNARLLVGKALLGMTAVPLGALPEGSTGLATNFRNGSTEGAEDRQFAPGPGFRTAAGVTSDTRKKSPRSAVCGLAASRSKATWKISCSVFNVELCV